VQVARDAGPLADPLFQAHVELPRRLTHAELIQPQSSARNAATHDTRNQVVWYQAGATENSMAAPASFHTPLLLQAMTRKR
jgi:hypothetical protein